MRPPRMTPTLLFAALVALALTACGTPEQDPEGPTEPAPTAEDMGPDLMTPAEDMRPAAEDMGPEEPPPPMCPGDGELFCNGLCVDPMTEPRHCGRCFRNCGSRGVACVAGDCACFDTKEEFCPGFGCVDKKTHLRNCGVCGNRCKDNEYCDNGTCTGGGYFNDVILLTNQARAQAQNCGGTMMPPVDPVTKNDLLGAAAQEHAVDMANRMFFAHDNPDGVTPNQRMRAAGYEGSITGENIARGQPDPEAVVQAWIDSPGHCRNMMNARFNELGIGYYQADGGPYWVQNFGAP